MREEFAECEAMKRPRIVGANDGEVRPDKFAEDLTTGPAGEAVAIAVSGDGDGLEAPLALADRLDDGSLLTADAHAISGVFDVTTEGYGAIFAEESGADVEVGVWDVSAGFHFNGEVDELLVCHDSDSFREWADSALLCAE